MDEKQKRQWLLGEAPVGKALAALAVPSLLAMLVTSLYNFVDAFFIGKLGDTNAIAAVSVGFPLFIIMAAVGQMLGIGAAAFTGRKLGAGEKATANRTASITVLLGIGLATFTTVFGLLFIRPILTLMGALPQVMPYAIKYSGTLLAGSIFFILNMIFNNLLRAEGAARRSMYTIMLGAVLNILLDPLFIFVLDMGIMGAALASVTAQACTSVYCISYYARKRAILVINKASLRTKTPEDRKIVGEIFKIGLPVFGMQALSSVSYGILNAEAATFSAAALASLGIANKVFTILLQLIMGFTQAYMPFVAYNAGAKNLSRVKHGTRFSLAVTMGIGLAGTLLFQTFPAQTAALFSGGDPGLIELAANALKSQTYMLAPVAFILTLTVFFQATGKASQAAILSIGRQGIFLIPAALLLPKFFSSTVPQFLQNLVKFPMENGLYGVMFAQPTADLITLVLCVAMAVVAFRSLDNGI